MTVTHQLVVILYVGATLACCISANSRIKTQTTDTNDLERCNQTTSTQELLVSVTTQSALANVTQVSAVSNRNQDCLKTEIGLSYSHAELGNILDRNKTDQNTNLLLLSGEEKLELPSKLGECDVITLAMCQQKETMHNNVWNVTCVNDTSSVPPKIELCSKICLFGRRERCEDLCPEYRKQCLQPATTSAPTNSATIQWPDGPRRCDVGTNMCHAHSSNKSNAWRAACINDTSRHPPKVRSCWTICRINRLKCEHACPEYLKQCLPTTTTMVTTSTADRSEWMYGPIQCNVTVSMCQQQPTNSTRTWRVVCFFDTSSGYLVDPEIMSCADVCLPVSDPHLKCADLCKGFLHYCYPPTTTTEHTHVHVTSVPSIMSTEHVNVTVTGPLAESTGLATSSVIAVIIVCVLVLLTVLVIVCWCVRRRQKKNPRSCTHPVVRYHPANTSDSEMTGQGED